MVGAVICCLSLIFNQMEGAHSWEVGDKVLALYAHGDFYEARICEVRENGTYLVEWADGDDRHREKRSDQLNPYPDPANHSVRSADDAAVADSSRRSRRGHGAVLPSTSKRKRTDKKSCGVKKAHKKPPPVEPVRAPMAATGLQGSSVEVSRCRAEKAIRCREAETERIVKFCKDCVGRQKAASMYISGTPGVGKTLTIYSAQRIFRAWHSEHQASALSAIVNINAMQLADPEKLFQLLHTELFADAAVPSKDVRQKFGERLKRSWQVDSHMTFLFIDEIDMLLASKNVSVLHAVFEYPHWQNSKLVVIGIANSIDLTERTLPFLEQRGCAPERVHFHPYNADQLIQILQQRLSQSRESSTGSDSSSAAMPGDNLWEMGFEKVQVDPSAVEFCAKKVAAVSGDVRKLLALCSKSITLAARRKPPLSTTIVDISHVSQASTELFGGKYVEIIRDLPQHQRVAVCAAVKLLRGSNDASDASSNGWRQPVKDPDLAKLYKIYVRLSRAHELHWVSFTEFTDMCETSLVHHRILDIASARAAQRRPTAGGFKKKSGSKRVCGDGRRVTLLVKEADVRRALSKWSLFEKMLQD